MDYVARLSSLDDAGLCNVNVDYAYELENIGEACEQITKVISIIDGKTVPLPVSAWHFCPTEIETIVDTRSEDLCAYSGKEIEFIVTLNDKEGGPTASFIGFPEPA